MTTPINADILNQLTELNLPIGVKTFNSGKPTISSSNIFAINIGKYAFFVNGLNLMDYETYKNKGYIYNNSNIIKKSLSELINEFVNSIIEKVNGKYKEKNVVNLPFTRITIKNDNITTIKKGGSTKKNKSSKRLPQSKYVKNKQTQNKTKKCVMGINE